jgi:hypothetical protein
MYRAQQGPLNDSKVSRGESAAAKVLLEGGVAEHRAADAASTADLSAVRIEDLTRRILEKTAHGGLMGCGERPGGLLRGTFWAPTSLS